MLVNKFLRGATIETVNIVIDVGSSSIRAIAFTIKGEAIASVKSSYETFYPFTGWAEQNPHDWENATLISLTELERFQRR